MSRDILLAQLSYINDFLVSPNDITVDPWVQELIVKFKIPDSLVPVFVIYAEEYLQDVRGCLKEDGLFWDEDVLYGIIQKFRAFFLPILKYANPGMDWPSADIIIEPSYEGTSAICIVADGQCVYLEYIKAWSFSIHPDGLLNHLGDLAKKFSVKHEVLFDLPEIGNMEKVVKDYHRKVTGQEEQALHIVLDIERKITGRDYTLDIEYALDLVGDGYEWADLPYEDQLTVLYQNIMSLD